MCTTSSLGHNYPSLLHFSGLLSESFDEVICLASNELDTSPQPNDDVKGFFHYYYDDFAPLANRTESRWVSAFAGARDLAIRTSDPLEAVAISDCKRMLQDYDVTSEDAVLFPSVDFYGVVGMLGAISSVEPERRPRLFLRFIGVMESASRAYARPFDELLRRISRYIAIGGDVKISAEVPLYADYLSARLSRLVYVTPYPPVFDLQPLDTTGPFTVSAIGSARGDKGFFQLSSIFSEIRRRDPDLNVRFTCQLLPQKDLAHQRDYASQLYALPGLTLFPGNLPGEAIERIYRMTHIILLPYDAEIYRLRGSAAMMEGIAIGRPVLTSPGTAFAKQVEYYNLGKICEGPSAYADAVIDYLRTPRRALQASVTQARVRFFSDALGSLNSWVN